MKKIFLPLTSRPYRQAFTLIELMTVMAIMAILLAAVVPALTGVNESNNISGAGQTVADQVNLARQIASANNITVDVICMQLLGANAPAAGFNAILLWSPTRAGPLSRIIKLPDGIAISQDTGKYSTLFASYPPPATPPPQPPTTLPNGATVYKYFSVTPAGMVGPLNAGTPPPDMSLTTLGILPARFAAAGNNAVVHNYMLVQVNPITAATLIYRP